jgi:hypothetical protein
LHQSTTFPPKQQNATFDQAARSCYDADQRQRRNPPDAKPLNPYA